MVTLLKLARLKRGAILMAKRTVLICATLAGVLLMSPIIGYGEDTVATIKVQQATEDAQKAEDAAANPDEPPKLTIKQKAGDFWKKYAVEPAKKAKAGALAFGNQVIGTDERLERKRAEVKMLREELIRTQGLLSEKDYVYGLDLAKSKSCVDNLHIFLDGLQEK